MTAKPPVSELGPEAERLKIEERAVAKAFKAKKPEPELDEPKEVKKPARK
jgi:hypothetical protein